MHLASSIEILFKTDLLGWVIIRYHWVTHNWLHQHDKVFMEGWTWVFVKKTHLIYHFNSTHYIFVHDSIIFFKRYYFISANNLTLIRNPIVFEGTFYCIIFEEKQSQFYHCIHIACTCFPIHSPFWIRSLCISLSWTSSPSMEWAPFDLDFRLEFRFLLFIEAS